LAAVGDVAAVGEGERLEVHARGVEVFVGPACRVHAVEATDDKAVDHVDHRLGNRAIPGLEGVDALLHDHPADAGAALACGHPGALLAIQCAYVVGAVGGHDAHAVGPGVGLDDHERFAVDAVLRILECDRLQQGVGVARQALLALAFHEIDLPAVAAQRVEQPGVDADQITEFAGNRLVVGEMA